MLHKLFYKSKYHHNVSIAYFRDENLNDKESLVILPMEQNSNEEWSINIEASGELIYKFISDSMYIMNDPYAENYIEIEGQGIWSKVKESQSKMKKKMPNVRNIYICKDIDDNYNLIESTNIIKPVDNLMICHTEITSISEDFLVSMFWKNESGIVFAAIDDLVKFDGRKERIVFTGVNIKDIINTNVFQNGKYQVEVFINGVFSNSIEFCIKKLLNYGSNLHKNQSLYKKIENYI